MPKLLLLAFALPFVLAAVVLVAPFACVYFLFDRLCDLIEEFKPTKARRGRRQQPNKAHQLGRVLSLISNRGQATTNHKEG